MWQYNKILEFIILIIDLRMPGRLAGVSQLRRNGANNFWTMMSKWCSDLSKWVQLSNPSCKHSLHQWEQSIHCKIVWIRWLHLQLIQLEVISEREREWEKIINISAIYWDNIIINRCRHKYRDRVGDKHTVESSVDVLLIEHATHNNTREIDWINQVTQ